MIVGLGALSIAFLALVALAGAIIGGISGFGAGLIVSPFLVPVVGLEGVVPVITVAMMLGNLSRLWVYRAHVERAPVLRVLLPALPGLVIGVLVYGALPRTPLAITLGLFLLASIPLRRWLAVRRVTPTPLAIAGVGFVFGLVTGTVPGGGVIVVPLLLGMGLAGSALVGTDAVIGLVISVLKVVLLGSLALMDTELAITGVLVGLCMVPGAYAARWLIARVSLHHHTLMVEAMVAASGLSFLWSAWA